MKNKSIRGLALLMCLVLMTSVLVACNGDKTKEESTSSTASGNGSWSQGIPTDMVELTKTELIILVKEALGEEAADFSGDLSTLSEEQITKVKNLASSKGYAVDENDDGTIRISKAVPLVALSDDEVIELAGKVLGDDIANFTGNLADLTEEQLEKIKSEAEKQGYYVVIGTDGAVSIKKKTTATTEEISKVVEDVLGENVSEFNGNTGELPPEKQSELSSELGNINADQEDVKGFWESVFGSDESPTVSTTAAAATTTTTAKNTTTTKKAPVFTQEQPTVHEATTKSTTALSTQKVSSVASEFIVNVNNITASFSDCVATEDGGFVAAGATLEEDPAALIAKIDKKGNIDWVHEIKGNNMLAFECVEVLDNGSIIACGYSAATDLPELQGGYACTDTIDGLIMKFNKRGDLQWSKTIGGSGDDTIYSIEEAPDGSIYIGGNTSSRDGTFSKITADPKYRFSAFIIKYTDSDFDTIIDDCCAAFSTSFSSQTSDLSCADNGDLFAAVYAVKTDGDLASIGAGTTGAGKTIALKYDKNGAFQWSQIFWGSGQTRLSSILATNDGGCILGGSYSSKSNPGTGTFDGVYNGGNTGTPDGVVIKLRADGKIYWKEMFNGFEQDVIEDIIETDSGFAVVGQSTSVNRDFDAMDNKGDYDIFVYTISPLGRKQAMASLGGSNSDKAFAACLLEDGSIAIAGNTCSDDGSFAGLTPAGSKTQAAATVAKFNLTIAE